ncbi:MAG: ABC transporter permease [Alphaproteobacteria bacterium]
MVLSPLTQRRLAQFRKNRRAFISLWLFCGLLFAVSIAEFLCNDKPFLVVYDGQPHFPIFFYYPESAFGGDFETEADYRDPFVQELVEKKGGWMLWPPVRYSYHTVNLNLPTPAPSPPSMDNWLGTDDHGRDLLSRLVYGFRTSLFFGLILTFFSSLIGVLVGASQGYFGGKIDLIFQRFIEIWSGLPILFLLMILASFVQPNFGWLLGLMLLFSWMSLVGVVRAEFLRARNYDYVKAAQVLGVPSWRIIWRHILPNAMVAALTFLPFLLNHAIATLTSLDFLGFGLPLGSASLGELLQQGKNNLHAPWLGITAFFSIASLLTLVTFIGEGLRDAFDPRKNIMPTSTPGNPTLQHAPVGHSS